MQLSLDKNSKSLLHTNSFACLFNDDSSYVNSSNDPVGWWWCLVILLTLQCLLLDCRCLIVKVQVMEQMYIEPLETEVGMLNTTWRTKYLHYSISKFFRCKWEKVLKLQKVSIDFYRISFSFRVYVMKYWFVKYVPPSSPMFSPRLLSKCWGHIRVFISNFVPQLSCYNQVIMQDLNQLLRCCIIYLLH